MIGAWRPAALVFLLLLLHAPAHADRRHTVKQGQTLGSIARRYKVSVTNLAAANRLKKTSNLKVGKKLKIPPKGVIYVYQGQTLGRIAKANKVSIKALARANGIKTTSTLRVGQRLVLPGYSAREKAARARNKILNGTVMISRPAHKEDFKGKLFDKNGKVNAKARAKLGRVLRDRFNDDVKKPSVRLMRVLAYLAEHFNGRKIVVVSAFRSPKNGSSSTSRHAKGEAVDVRIEGVANETLRDYCLTLSRVGVGYYPRSSFVHIDVRKEAAYWVDWSRPGEPPLYLPPGQTPELIDGGVR